MIYPYWFFEEFSEYMQTDELISLMGDVLAESLNKIWFYPNLSFQIPSLDGCVLHQYLMYS